MASPSRKARTASLHDDAYAVFVRMLIDRRLKAGMSQQAVADALGWNQSIIAKVESVQRRLDVIELIRIASVVGFDPAKLVRDTESVISKAQR